MTDLKVAMHNNLDMIALNFSFDLNYTVYFHVHCLVVCLTLLASFFHLSLKHVHVYIYIPNLYFLFLFQMLPLVHLSRTTNQEMLRGRYMCFWEMERPTLILNLTR